MPESVEQTSPPSPVRVFFGWVGVVILLGMFIISLFGDIFVWMICGTKFVLSPAFHRVEYWLHALLGVSFMTFMGLDKGLEHIQKRQWKPILIPLLIFFFGTMPFAQPCAIMIRFTTAKGIMALSQPKIDLLIVFLVLIFVCKCKALFNLWRLTRKTSEPLETRRIVIENHATTN